MHPSLADVYYKLSFGRGRTRYIKRGYWCSSGDGRPARDDRESQKTLGPSRKPPYTRTFILL